MLPRTLVALLLLLGLACSPAAPGVQVGFLLNSTEKERYHKDRAAFTERVEALGGRVRFESAGGESGEQQRLGRSLLEGGVDALVVQPVDAAAAAALVAEARGRSIPIVAYDRLPPDLGFDWAVLHDSVAAGRYQAEYALRALGPAGGEVAILQGAAGNPVAEALTRGNLQALRKAPRVSVLEVVPHPRWVAEESRRTVRRLLEGHPDLAAVLANNSALARGAVEALQEAGRAGKVYVAGADADLTNCQWVAQGLQGMDVLKPIEPLAAGAAEVAMALARRQDPASRPRSEGTRVERSGRVPTLVLPVVPFDRANLEGVVVGSGFHPREALFPLAPSPGR